MTFRFYVNIFYLSSWYWGKQKGGKIKLLRSLQVITFFFSDDRRIAYPISFPSFAKKLLISLCKDVPFQVKCVACHQTLRSHMELTAHFRFVRESCPRSSLPVGFKKYHSIPCFSPFETRMSICLQINQIMWELELWKKWIYR